MESRSSPDPYYVLRGPAAPVNVIQFAPVDVAPEGILASGSSKGVISLWDLKTKRVRQTLEKHNGQSIVGLDFLSNGSVVSQGRDGFIRIWENAKGIYQLVSSLTNPAIGFCKISTLKKDGCPCWMAVPGSEQSQVDIVDVGSQQRVHRIIPEAEKSFGMCMCAKLFLSPLDQKPLILIGFENGGVMLWDIKAGRMVSNEVLHSEPVMCLDVDEGSLRFISGSADNKLFVSSISSEYKIVTDKEIMLKTPGVASIKVRSDHKIVVAGCWDGRIRVYSWKKLRPLAYLNYHTETVNSVEFSEASLPLGNHWGFLLAAGTKDSRISLWDLYNE